MHHPLLIEVRNCQLSAILLISLQLGSMTADDCNEVLTTVRASERGVAVYGYRDQA